MFELINSVDNNKQTFKY